MAVPLFFIFRNFSPSFFIYKIEWRNTTGNDRGKERS